MSKTPADIDRSASRLTDTILGYSEGDLSDMLGAIALEIGLHHVAHLRFSAGNGREPSLPTAIATYSRAWQTRYFLKGYMHIDPVVAKGRNALLPFDWETLASKAPAVVAFLADAAKHSVGRNGLSVPVRNRAGAQSLVSYTSDHSKTEWVQFKRANMTALQRLASLIDSAADAQLKLPLRPVALSQCEEQCLIWAAKGKTVKEISDAMNLRFARVMLHLDTARHKLHCMNLSHAIAVAVATGAIPAKSLL